MKRFPLIALLAFGLVACETDVEDRSENTISEEALDATTMVATARLSPTEGNNVSGEVTFTQEAGMVRVQGTLTGLAPGGHGFHVHENGACGPGEDGTPGGAAGGHWAPQGSPHGAPDSDAVNRHVGDMGNITAGQDGMATIQHTDNVLTLEGANSIVGKAVVVHANADDLTSQPSGDAGGRVACGVVEMRNAAGMGTTGTPSM